jgi:hypothetical protein
MPSWIKEQDGVEWFDEAYTSKQTNQKPAQLHKKVIAGKLRSLNDANGVPAWYARPDVEKLREAFLKRRSNALDWKPNDQQIEARHTRQWQAGMEIERKSRVQNPYGGAGSGIGPVALHHENVMIKDIAAKAAKKREEQ